MYVFIFVMKFTISLANKTPFFFSLFFFLFVFQQIIKSRLLFSAWATTEAVPKKIKTFFLMIKIQRRDEKKKHEKLSQ